MIAKLRVRDNTKFCTFHSDYGQLTEDCTHLMWKVNKLVKKGSLKEFISGSGQQGQVVGKRKKPKESRSGVDEDKLEEEALDATVSTIHGGFASRGVTMTANRRHLREAEMMSVGTTDHSVTDHPDIVFTRQDAEGFHFSHENALIV